MGVMGGGMVGRTNFHRSVKLLFTGELHFRVRQLRYVWYTTTAERMNEPVCIPAASFNSDSEMNTLISAEATRSLDVKEVVSKWNSDVLLNLTCLHIS
jgi:hypothetical protein